MLLDCVSLQAFLRSRGVICHNEKVTWGIAWGPVHRIYVKTWSHSYNELARMWYITLLSECKYLLAFQSHSWARVILSAPQCQSLPWDSLWPVACNWKRSVHFWALKAIMWGDFPGGLVVKTLLRTQGAWVWSLVGELGSHMLQSVAKKKINIQSCVNQSYFRLKKKN